METNVVQGAFKPRRWWQRWQFSVAVLAAVLIVAGVLVFAHIEHNRDVQRQNASLQQSLQTQLSQSIFAKDNDTTTAQLATQLINGAKSKKFSLNTTDLAQAYLDRASANSNLGKLPAALSDFQAAVAADSAVKVGALEGELTVQSKLGDKAALVPLLQQLVPLVQNSGMPLAASQAAQYQADIAALQSGQEVTF